MPYWRRHCQAQTHKVLGASVNIREMPFVFVYGSLRSGESNHAQLAGAVAIGVTRTAPRFTLIDLGEFPALIADGHDRVTGEVYEVSAEHLARLDAFEEHPHVYARSTIELEDGREVLAYLPAKRPEGPRIASGDWCRFRLGASPADR